MPPWKHRFCVAATLLVSAAAFAQSYPARSIRIMVPLAPGGSADIDARLVGDKLSQAFGQPVVIENRPGGGGTIGVSAIAKAAPDGYTIGIGPAGTLTINPTLMKLPYDTQKDLAPLSGLVRSTLLIVTSPSGPIQSIKDLIAYGKSRGAVTFGSPNVGSAQHLVGELLKARTGIDMVHVPYKGAADSVIAVLGGQILLAVVAPGGMVPQIRSGKLRAIGSTDSERFFSLPEVPTVAESGVPGFEATGWLALFAPGGTPRDIVMRLNAEIVRALNMADVREKIAANAETPHPTSPEELARFVRAETEKWAGVIKAAGIKLEL